MFLGLKRDTWAQLWFSLMVAAMLAGIAIINGGFGLNNQDSGMSGWWLRFGWIGLIVGVIGIVLGAVALYVFRPKDGRPKKPPSLLGRLLRWVLSLRISTGDPSWLVQAADRDAQNLPSTLHPLGELQYDNVWFDLDNRQKPNILFRFRYVNASVYTLRFESLEGQLQVNGSMLAGQFEFQPVVAVHNSAVSILFRFVINVDASVTWMKSLLEEEEQVYFDFGSAHISIQGIEDETVIGELRFPQQFWKPRRESMQ